ncbi:hypothetical protein V8C86DRAFT_3028757 [Haematococcus lacustris]
MRIPLVSYPAAAWLAYKVVRQLTECLARVLWRSPRLVSITDLRTLMQVTESASSAAQAAGGVHAIILPDQGMYLSYIPPLVMTFRHLTRLEVPGSAIVACPHSIRQLVNLQTLDFSCCCLTSLPMELGDLSHLTSLNASHNKLVSLHPHFCSLTSLVTLNLMGNNLTQLPERFGDLKSLRLLGLKSNRLTYLPASFTALTSLVELFITDNQLTALPSGFGGLMSLVKLQASFNPLASLPPDMLALPRLELLRVAVCQLPSLPSPLWAQEQQGSPGLAAVPGYAWPPRPRLSPQPAAACQGHGGELEQGSGQPGPPSPDTRPDLQQQQHSVELLAQAGVTGPTGSGPGLLHLSMTQVLAAKIFRADVSPDGRTVEEVAIACAVDHPNLTRVQAVVALAPPAPAPAAPPAAAPEPAPMLLMDLVPGQPLAAKPTSQHLLRCNHVITMLPGVMVVLALRLGAAEGEGEGEGEGAPLTPTRWRPDTQFSLQQVVAIGTALSSALAYLHARCICHGDVYAHNVLWSPATAGCPGPDRITLCDFGASFSYKEGEWFWQAMEVRAFGLLMNDVQQRLHPGSQGHASGHAACAMLAQLVVACQLESPAARPGFQQLHDRFLAMAAS